MGRRLNVDRGSLSRVGLYVLSPALTFNAIYTSTIRLAVTWRLAASTLALPFILVTLFGAAFKAVRSGSRLSRAMLLPASFANAANFGLPICLYAFGEEGMSLGAVFVVCQNLLIHTLAVYVAATTEMTPGSAVKRVLRMPTAHAAWLAVVIRLFKVGIPVPLSRAVALLAQAAPPVFLLVLGIWLATAENSPKGAKLQLASVFFRLVFAPVTAGVIGKMLGLSGLPWKVLVLQAAMPPPVAVAIIANEFNAFPLAVSTTVLWGTVASVGSLTAWLTILRRF